MRSWRIKSWPQNLVALNSNFTPFLNNLHNLSSIIQTDFNLISDPQNQSILLVSNTPNFYQVHFFQPNLTFIIIDPEK